MNVTFEITLAPFNDEYKSQILNFISAIKSSGFKITENALSTDIEGDFEAIMDFLKSELSNALELVDKGMIFIKIKK